MKKIIILLILIPIWFLSVKMNTKLTDLPLNREERMSSVITSEQVRPFMLGYESVVADYIWIKAILYFGGNYNSGDLSWMKELIKSVVILNPSFYPPYEFAGVMLPDITGDYDFTRRIVSHGIGRVNRAEERLMFYLAYINYDKYGDNLRAADLLSYASTADFAPPFWKTFAATLYNNSGKLDMGLFFLQGLYETTESPQLKEEILKKIDKLTNENINEK